MKPPLPIKKILLAINLGERSTEMLIETASSLAKRFKAEVIPVSAIENNFYYSEAPYETWDFFDDYKKKMKKKLLDTEESLRTKGIEVCSSIAREGVPYRVIQSVAEQMNPDLVVIGANRKGVMERIMGTTAEHVIRKVNQPVWIVHSNDASSLYKNILCPIDCSPESDHTLACAIQFSKVFQAHLHILHILPQHKVYPSFDNFDNSIADWGIDTIQDGYLQVKLEEDETKHANRILNERLQKFDMTGLEVSKIIQKGVVDRQIIQVFGDTNCDLLILGACEKKGLSHFFKGTTDTLLRKMTCSVVTVKHITKEKRKKKHENKSDIQTINH